MKKCGTAETSAAKCGCKKLPTALHPFPKLFDFTLVITITAGWAQSMQGIPLTI